eukprot:m.16687 g.16687  ORF g.16687 m.16687 type:complete len:192 (+) comp27068_c0_seq1:237-812(+)
MKTTAAAFFAAGAFIYAITAVAVMRKRDGGENVYLQEFNLKCPDGSLCPETSTCCEIGRNEFGCCLSPEAVCCSDKKHCCENGFMCTSSNNSCSKEEDGVFIQAMNVAVEERHTPLVRGTPKKSVASLSDIHCPPPFGGTCDDNFTCCPYSCCPYPDANCCAGLHCCPHGSDCVTDCIRRRINNKITTNLL